MELTERNKQQLVTDTTAKLSAILQINGLSLTDLDAKMFSTLIMVYQEGVKVGKGLSAEP